jgi:hypothetical protein
MKEFMKSLKTIHYIGAVAVVVLTVVIVVLLTQKDVPASAVSEDVYEQIDQIKHDKVDGMPALELEYLHEKGAIPNYAGYYFDASGESMDIYVRMKGLATDEIQSIEDEIGKDFFVFVDADYTLDELNEAFNAMVGDINISAHASVIQMDIAKNRIIVKTYSSEEFAKYIGDIDLGIIEFVIEDDAVEE